MDDQIIRELHAARKAEKEQALFYRALAARAEQDSAAQLSDDLNGLHADEQHHLSRISVRLLELAQPLEDLNGVVEPAGGAESWRTEARRRELAEVDRYTHLLTLDLDDPTRALIEEILTTETQHATALAGKYTNA